VFRRKTIFGEALAKPSAHLVGSRVPRDRRRAGRASLPGFASASGMSVALKFWMLVALLCGAFAVAEYLYACETICICRNHTRPVLYRIAAILVLLVDCLGFLGCMNLGMSDCIYFIYVWGPPPIVPISLGLLLGPSFMLFLGPLFLGGSSVILLLPDPLCDAMPALWSVRWTLTIIFLVVSLAAPIMRVAVMCQAKRRKWWKVAFVFYVTYCPVALMVPDMIGR